jgi:hypothetical protein
MNPNIVQGQLVTWLLNAAGKLTDERKTLARAEAPERRAWQVTLAPIVENGIGTDLAGMPAWRATPGASGDLAVVLTLGGGGVSFRFPFNYPVAGASFAVAGDNIMVEVSPRDLATVFTDQTKPSVVGWVKPLAATTARDPLVIPGPQAAGVLTPVYPFARALLVGTTNPAATMQVAWSRTLGAVGSIALPAGFHRIPVPAAAEAVTITPSAGLIAAYWEIALT